MDGEKMCGWLGCSGGWLVGTLGLDRPCYRCRTDTNTGMGGEKEGGGAISFAFSPFHSLATTKILHRFRAGHSPCPLSILPLLDSSSLVLLSLPLPSHVSSRA